MDGVQSVSDWQAWGEAESAAAHAHHLITKLLRRLRGESGTANTSTPPEHTATEQLQTIVELTSMAAASKHLVARAPAWSQPPLPPPPLQPIQPREHANTTAANTPASTAPAHPADVLALAHGAAEVTTRQDNNPPATQLHQAIQVIRETVPFVEQQAATKLAEAVSHIRSWIAQHWEEETAYTIESQSQVPHTSEHPLPAHTAHTHDPAQPPTLQQHEPQDPPPTATTIAAATTTGGSAAQQLETPELEEGIRLAHLLSEPWPNQPPSTTESIQQDLQTIAYMFRETTRRIQAHGPLSPTKAESAAMERGRLVCKEAAELLDELTQQVGAGLRGEHMRGILEQVITRAHTAREALETLHEAHRAHTAPETSTTTHWSPPRDPTPRPLPPESPMGANYNTTRAYYTYAAPQPGVPLPPRRHRLPEHRRRREHEGISDSD